jgi:hypothetical protein
MNEERTTMHPLTFLYAGLVLVFVLGGCTVNHYNAVAAAPPVNSSIVGTWKLDQAGEHKIHYPFFIKFNTLGKCTSGPTPRGVRQIANYTFDGSDVVIDPGVKQIVMPDVKIDGNEMVHSAEDAGQPIVVTYKRVWRW